MVYWALKAADVLNPHTILIEEVPKFLTSGAGYILRMALARSSSDPNMLATGLVEDGLFDERS